MVLVGKLRGRSQVTTAWLHPGIGITTLLIPIDILAAECRKVPGWGESK